jgi:hypothetical protein
MPERPIFLLDLRIADLSGWWLDIHCPACRGRSGSLAFQYVETHRPGLRLGDVLRRLRCRECRQPPARVTMLGDATDRAPGRGAVLGGWRIEITLPDAGYRWGL